MIIAFLYEHIYIWLVTIFTIFVVQAYYNKKNVIALENIRQTYASIFICILFIVYIGMRPDNIVFQDSCRYVSAFESIEGFPFIWNSETQNPLFDNLLRYMASLRLGFNSFFLVIAAIYFGGIWFVCYKFFPKNVLLTFLVFLAAFSTYSYSTNGIKAGAATSIFLIGLAFFKDKKRIPLFGFVFISYFCHHSMVMCIAAFVVVYFYNKNSKFYFIGWCACLFLAILHVTFFQELLGRIMTDQGDEHGAGYLLNNGMQDGWMKIGFRPDFVFYSAMPVIVGYYAKFKMQIKNKTYDLILHLYLTLNGIWMLCMYASYTNRIAYLSWFLYPIVLIYPIIFADGNLTVLKGKMLKRIVYCHLGFTLAMKYVYYVFLH